MVPVSLFSGTHGQSNSGTKDRRILKPTKY